MTVSDVFARARDRNGMRTTISLALLTFCASLLCQSSSAYAAVPSQSDAQRVSKWTNNVIQLKGDVARAGSAPAGNPGTCLLMMSATLDVLADHGNEITGLVSISAKMQLVADEATVNYMLANRIKAYREQAHNSRQQINIAASTCNDDYFVNEKAGEAIQMVSEFDEVLDSLQSKLGGTGQ